MRTTTNRTTSNRFGSSSSHRMIATAFVALATSTAWSQCVTNTRLMSRSPGSLNDAATYAGGIVVCGQFAALQAVSAANIGRFVDGQFTPLGGGLDDTCIALEVNETGDTLYAAGWFNNAGAVSARRIAAWDGLTWSSLGAGPNNGLASGLIYDIHAIGSDVYIAGNFTTAGTTTQVGGIAYWNGSTWNRVGPSGTNGVVYSIAEFEGQIVIAGVFSLVGGVPVTNIARFDGTTWSAMGNVANVNSLEVCDGVLFAGSALSEGVRRWNGSTWVDDRHAGQPAQVTELFCDGQRLFAATLDAVVWLRQSNETWVPVYAYGPISFGGIGGFAALNDRLFVASWSQDAESVDDPLARFDRLRFTNSAPPAILQQPADTHADLNGPLALTIEINGNAGFVGFQWYRDDQLIVGATQRTYAKAQAALDDAGEYRIEVSNPCGVTVSDIATVTIRVPCVGDIDENLRVDLSDLARLLASFGLCSGSPGYDPATDLNDTNCVDLIDLSTLLSVFGSECP